MVTSWVWKKMHVEPETAIVRNTSKVQYFKFHLLKKMHLNICCDVRHCPSSQLRSTSRAGTPAPPPPACRALKRPFTRRGKRWPSPATLATSCRVRPASTASPDTRPSGTAPPLPAEVNNNNTPCHSFQKHHIWTYSAAWNMRCALDFVSVCKCKDFESVIYLSVICSDLTATVSL